MNLRLDEHDLSFCSFFFFFFKKKINEGKKIMIRKIKASLHPLSRQLKTADSELVVLSSLNMTSRAVGTRKFYLHIEQKLE